MPRSRSRRASGLGVGPALGSVRTQARPATVKPIPRPSRGETVSPKAGQAASVLQIGTLAISSMPRRGPMST